MTTPKIAVQARVWGNNKLDQEYPRIFDEIIRAGYAGAEVRFTLADKGEELNQFLSDKDLQIIALHTNLGSFEAGSKQFTDINSLLDKMNRIGATYLLVSHGKQQEYGKWFELQARLTEVCAKQGVQFCYHNHAGEFEYEGFFDELTAHNVALAADLAWVWKAGKDPLAFVDRYAKHIKYVHVKDTTKEQWKELGQGDVQLEPILERVKALNLPWWTVEQDDTDKDPFVSAEMSRSYLKARIGI